MTRRYFSGIFLMTFSFASRFVLIFACAAALTPVFAPKGEDGTTYVDRRLPDSLATSPQHEGSNSPTAPTKEEKLTRLRRILAIATEDGATAAAIALIEDNIKSVEAGGGITFPGLT